MGSNAQEINMWDSNRSTRQFVMATIASLSMFTAAISAQQQHSQSLSNVSHYDILLSDGRSYPMTDAIRELTPRRRPPNVDRAKRMHALPPMITKTNNVLNTIQQTETPRPIRKKQSPYYPSIQSSTCLNDNNYPDYYLYDIKSYFFQSPQACCERHFGKSVGKKGGGMLRDGGVDQCLAALTVGETRMIPLMGGVDMSDRKRVTPKNFGSPAMTMEGRDGALNGAKTGKASFPGSSGAATPPKMYPEHTVPIGSGKAEKMLSRPDSLMGSSTSVKMFQKPHVPHSTTLAGAGKSDNNNASKGSVLSGDVLSSRKFPKPPAIQSASTPRGSANKMSGYMQSDKSNKLVPMYGSSSLGADSQTFKSAQNKESGMTIENMPQQNHPVSGLGYPYKKSNKYLMPPKRPPPPELDEGPAWINPGWNQPPPPPLYSEWQHPYAKSAKAKSFKSGKAKSAKSKAGKLETGSPWWGAGSWWGGWQDSRPHTYSPTYMPTMSDDTWQSGWLGGGGSSNGQQNPKPGGKPGSGGYGSGKPGAMPPHSNWGQPGKPEEPVYNPGWGASGTSPAWGAWQTPMQWGNSWWGSDSVHHGSQLGSGWNSWGNAWWGGGWGGSLPKPSIPTAKPIMLTPKPTPKPTGLFPTETPQPSSAIPTYSPTVSLPTYSPSGGIPTYSPSTAATLPLTNGTYSPTGKTYEPSPTSTTFAPTPTTSSYPPTGATLFPSSGGIPTFSPTQTPTETGDKTLPPTMPPQDLCAWGSGDSFGEQGGGDVLVPLPTDITGIDASAGSKYSLVVAANGVAYSSGFIEDMDTYHGHLGIRPQDLEKGTNAFQEISRVFDDSKDGVTDPPSFVKVFAGVENARGSGIIHTVLLDNEGRAWATGSNSKGQLCLGDEIDRLIPEIIIIEGIRIVDVAIGGEHTLLLDDNGNVYGCGSNEMGQLGLSSGTIKTEIPLKVYTLPKATSVSTGIDHSLFIAEDGLYVTGDNSFGQLCVDTKGKPLSQPQALDIPVDFVTSFEAISTSSYILFSDGSAIGCGNNNVGQLGNGEDKELVTFEPTVVKTDGFVVRLLGFGPSAKSIFFVSDEGSVYGTGLNTNGQLGVGDLENRNLPTKVVFENEVDISLLSAGEDHTVALKFTGGKIPAVPEGIPTSIPTPIPTPIISSSFPTPIATPVASSSIPTPISTPIITSTYAPSKNGTNNPTSTTFRPTLLTYTPTTPVPTFGPSTFAPTEQGYNFFFWGNPESIGQENEADVTQPLTIDGDVLYASAGSMYSIIVLLDGSASSAGVINSIESYQGHLGLDRAVLEGVNPLQIISNVYDTNETLLDAPAFDMAFAGVEHSPGSGVIHTVLLDRQGNAFSTGSNSKGQLCLGDNEDRLIPEQIPMEGRIVDVAIGGEHTLLLHENGTVYACGSNEIGQLGLGDDISQTSSPVILDAVSSVSSVSAGVDHSLFLSQYGIYVTGDNSYGQLCANNTDLLSTPMMIDISIENIASFEAIKFSSFIMYIDGSVNGCGKNDVGQLGDGTNDDKILTEVMLSDVVRLVGAGPSSESVFFVTADETMYGTGLNSRGNLGVGDFENRNVPTRVKFLEQVLTSAVSPSEDHTIAFGLVEGSLSPTVSPTPAPTYLMTLAPTRESSNFFFWGASDALGQGSAEDLTKPLYVDEGAIYTSAGSRYTLIVLQDGSVLAGGYVESKDNYQGQLGLGGIVITGANDLKQILNVFNVDDDLADAPAFDVAFAGVERDPASGVIHTILIDRLGNAYSTGSNSKGQLCLGDNEDRLIPAQIPIEGRIIDVAIGGEHTLLLHENGTVYACGSNEIGQLGLGKDVKDTSSPVILDALSSVSSVSAGVDHSLFITEDGLYVTGDNSYGQLCIENDVAALFEPQMLDISISDMTRFEAIRSSSFILNPDDELVNACGKNDLGQLGDGTNETTFFTTVAIDNVVRLLGTGPSADSVFFVAEDEVVYGTGLNARGNLGVGDRDNRNLPTRVKFPNEVLLSSLSAADDHTVALGSITGTLIPTISPTSGATTIAPTVTPTISPTRATAVPTNAPSYSPMMTLSSITPTFSPSGEPEVLNTYPPTSSISSPSSPSISAELFSWGAQESVGLSQDEVTSPQSLDKSVIDLSGGSRYSLILLDDGTAQAAGYIVSEDDYHGHLGLRAGEISAGEIQFTNISNAYDNDQIITSPPFSRVFAGVNPENEPGSIHSFLIDNEGQAWATGSNENGELCLGDFEDRLVPTKVTLDGNIVSVGIGAKHTLLLLDDGTVYACGSNEDGQLGLGQPGEVSVSSPTKIEGLADVRMISTGIASSLFVASDGLYVAGNNQYGQLCIDTNEGSLVEPTVLEGVNVDDVQSFEAISTSSYILFRDGSVGACGRNNFGQLGDTTNDDKFRVVVKPIPDNVPIRRLGVGPSSNSVFFVNDDGLVFATGLNDRGQLGVGDTENKNTLTLVEFGDNFVGNQQISASGDHTLSR
ncbi:hypothetical protein HJC23_012413 [Cyclotella cryptica]|uniref:RCC1-like domain-containing protein n=1 Tax=Cyclotella cryptica TaxID=29204 RepID=A0ABD3Q1G9_9STRA|eukprot:CCRYP_009347-RA/>CCRYP_009347-RA protein AED:0.02 eAED:0.02 QI:245/0.75/0.6/1/1/1/5/46/2457